VSDLSNASIMVMSRKPKLIEMTTEYEITGENGTPVFRALSPELRSSITLAGVILWTYPFHQRCERSHCGANARCLSSFVR
jgi:hypothetical protein